MDTKVKRDHENWPRELFPDEGAYLLACIRADARELLDAEVRAGSCRSELHSLIAVAYDKVRSADLAEAAGLSRQRIHQIVTEQRA